MLSIGPRLRSRLERLAALQAARVAIVVAAAVAPYGRLATCPLYPDAERAVTRNPAVTHGSFHDIVTSDFWGKKRGDATATGSYRPAVSFTYWVEVRLFGSGAAALHLLDMLVHATGAVLVLLLLQRLASAAPLAVGGAVLFGVHPAISDAVCSVVGRSDLFAGVSFLGALFLHLRAGRSPAPWWSEAGALALLAVALLSKEYAVVFPLLLVVFDALLVLRKPGGDRARVWRFALLALALVGAYLGARAVVLGSLGDVRMVDAGDTPLAGRSFAGRLANAVWLLVPALRLLCVPTGLDHVYGIGTLPLVEGPTDPRFLAGMALLLGAAWFGFRRLGRAADATPLLVLALFVLPLLPALNTVGVTALLFAERFLYVPAVGFSLLVASALGRTARSAAARRMAAALVVTIAALFAVLTARRVEDWRSNESLARAALRAHPRSAMALHELGMVHALRGEFAAAAPLVRASLDVQPTRPGVWRNYALVLDRLGRRAEAVDAWSRAVESASPRLPAQHAWRQGLAAAQAAAGESEAAIAALVRACEEHPGDMRIRWNLVRVALAGAEFQHAAGHAGDAARLAALALDGGELGADESFRAGLLLAGGGDMPRAARAFERARAKDAGIFARQRARAIGLLDAGRHVEAAEILAGLVAADPTDATARRELGRALLTGAPRR